MLFAGAAMAQTPSSDSGQNWQLTGANARLVHTIDAKSVREGQAVEAKLDSSVKTDQGVKLDKGSVLQGTVTKVQKASNGSPSTITLNFDKAQMKDGKTIPVKVTVLAAYPPSAGTQAMYGFTEVGSAPQHVNSNETVNQEPGQLRHIALRSKVQSDNSGTFEEKDGNVKLAAGTYLQVGIAAMNNNAASSGM
jgi:hypothetical protein